MDSSGVGEGSKIEEVMIVIYDSIILNGSVWVIKIAPVGNYSVVGDGPSADEESIIFDDSCILDVFSDAEASSVLNESIISNIVISK